MMSIEDGFREGVKLPIPTASLVLGPCLERMQRDFHNGFDWIGALLIGLCAPLGVFGQPALERQLSDALSKLPHAQTKLTACVVDLHSSRTVFALNADQSLTPASSMKVFTMAAALTELGPEFAFETILATDGTNLLVIGGGDPGFGDEKLSQLRGEAVTGAFEQWAAALSRQGMGEFAGDLVFDDTVFDRELLHPSWEPGDLGKWYAAPVAGLNINDNCLDFSVRPAAARDAPVVIGVQPPNSLVRIINQCRSGGKGQPLLHHPPGTFEYRITGRADKAWPFSPVAFPDPALLFADSLKTVFASRGVAIRGQLRRGRIRQSDGTLPQGIRVLAIHRTPIGDVLMRAGKNSQNLFAECLFKRAGLAWATRNLAVNPQGSFANGAGAVRAVLARAGIEESRFHVSDGSGLSRENSCSARQLVDILAWSHRQPWRSMLHDNLAVAGVDGSLKKRVKDLPDRVFAKTGTMRSVRALAGYVDGDSGPRYAFAVVFNGYKGPSTPYKAIQDKVCRILADAAETTTVGSR